MPDLYVKESPIAERPSDKASCPECGGAQLKHRGTSTTLLGGGDGTLDGDPNHRAEEYHCTDCGAQFFRQTKSGKVWYTAENAVLRGFPACFESYSYHCAACGGKVSRRYTNLTGEPTQWLTWSAEHGREYRTFFTCEGCGAEAESATDFPPALPGGPPRP